MTVKPETQLGTAILDEPKYSVAEAAKKLCVSRQHVRNLINQGELQGYCFGRKIMILESDLVEYIRGRRIGDHEAEPCRQKRTRLAEVPRTFEHLRL